MHFLNKFLFHIVISDCILSRRKFLRDDIVINSPDYCSKELNQENVLRVYQVSISKRKRNCKQKVIAQTALLVGSNHRQTCNYDVFQLVETLFYYFLWFRATSLR